MSEKTKIKEQSIEEFKQRHQAYREDLDRPDKLAGVKEIYFIARELDDNTGDLTGDVSVKKGKIEHFSLTTCVYTIYGENNFYFCSWDDIEPLTVEGYKILEEHLERIKAVREARSQIPQAKASGLVTDR